MVVVCGATGVILAVPGVVVAFTSVTFFDSTFGGSSGFVVSFGFSSL